MTRALGAALAALLALAIPGAAAADDPETDEAAHTDTMASRHRIELALGGGLRLANPRPEQIDVGVAGQLNARAMVDLVHVRADATVRMPDPTVPDRLHVYGDARLLFVVAHDVTWRRDEAGELFRFFGGLGGEIDLPDDFGHLMLSVGFAMHHLGPTDANERDFSEAYGAYAGLTLRMHFWEIRDELRIAVHGMMDPQAFVPTLDVEGILGQLVPGATVSNRLYLQALREGVISLGPELIVRYEGLIEGPVFTATLGLSGTLGL